MRRRFDMPNLGYGVGLRREHWDGFFGADRRGPERPVPGVDFFELLSENFMVDGGEGALIMERAVSSRPIVLHGTALSIGSVDPLDEAYLAKLRRLIEQTGALWFSDHLCFSSAFGVEYHDLVPVPFTEEVVAHVADRVRQVQRITEGLGREIPFLLENPSYYIDYAASTMSEAEFLSALVAEADCGLLLDVNNLYVNSVNIGYDPRACIDALPLERVVQVHMAGHANLGDVIIDTHGEPIIEPVFDLYAYLIERMGPVTTLLEWDNEVPGLGRLLEELERVRAVGEGAVGEGALPS